MNAVACGGCGTVNPADTKFCPRCGNRLPAIEQAPAAAPGVPPTNSSSPVAPAPPSQRRPIWPFAMVGVMVLAAVGGLSWFLLFSGTGGGASDPEAAVREFVEAVNGDDPLLIVQSVAPSEVEGMADLLRRLQARLDEQGLATWESDGTTFDLTIELASTSVVDRADDAALVEVDGAIEVDGIDWPGPLGIVLDERYEFDLGDVAEELDDRGVDELTIATVRESGGWYVSPMLSAANLAAGLADLPGPDLDRIGDELDRAAKDGEEAIESALDAALRLDFEELATVVTPAVSRLLTAFEDALEDFRDDAEDEAYTVSQVSIDVRDLGDGEYAVDDVEIVASTFDDVVDVRIRDDCIRVDGDDEGCVFDSFPGDLEIEQLVLHTTEVDGGFVVDPVASVADRVGDLIESIGYQHLLDGFGLAVFDDAQQATIGVPVELAFEGRPYVVLEYAPELGDRVSVAELDGEGEVDLFVDDGDGVWQRWRSRVHTADTDVVRAVAWAPVDDCGPVFCERDTSGSLTVVLHVAHRQELASPDQIVSGTLDAGDGYVFSFDVTSPGRYDFDVEEGDVEVEVTRDGSNVTGEVLDPGRYELEVWNTSDDETTFRVTPRSGR